MSREKGVPWAVIQYSPMPDKSIRATYARPRGFEPELTEAQARELFESIRPIAGEFVQLLHYSTCVEMRRGPAPEVPHD